MKKIGKPMALVLLVLVLGLLLFMRLGMQNPAATVVQDPTAAPTQKPGLGLLQKPPTELNAVLTAEELQALDLTGLKKLDLTGSTCYAAIEDFQKQHGELELVYAVLIEGAGEPLALAPDTETLELADGSYLPSLTENLRWLHRLQKITLAPDIAEAAAVDALQAAAGCEIDYQMHLGDALYPYTVEEITLTGMDEPSLRALLPEIGRFSHLKAVRLPQSGNSLGLEEALSLAAECKLLVPDYEIELFGQSLSLDAERIEFENAKIGNDGVEELRALLPYFRSLQYLKLDDCGVDNAVMEALRDDYPQVKVVWRVHFGSYHCLTDTEMIWATGFSYNDASISVLKYCTDVKYIDLGHSCITNVEFMGYMPQLEVVVISVSWVSSVEPLAKCPNLEYLEMFSTRVRDLSPLASCTHLQHLNISCQRNANNVSVGPTDISSLYGLQELQRFYCTMSYVPKEQQDRMIELHPDCEIEFRWVDPSKGYWRFKDGNPDNSAIENRTERYALLCEQFGYDTLQQSGKMWSLYG